MLFLVVDTGVYSVPSLPIILAVTVFEKLPPVIVIVWLEPNWLSPILVGDIDEIVGGLSILLKSLPS